MKLAQKWLELFAGYENENEGVNYKIAPFKADMVPTSRVGGCQ